MIIAWSPSKDLPCKCGAHSEGLNLVEERRSKQKVIRSFRWCQNCGQWKAHTDLFGSPNLETQMASIEEHLPPYMLNP